MKYVKYGLAIVFGLIFVMVIGFMIFGIMKTDKTKWGFVDKSGVVLVPIEFDEARDFSENLAAVKKGGLWGFIDTRGKVAIDFQFSEVGNFTSDGLC